MNYASGLICTIWMLLCGLVASDDDLFIERPIITTDKEDITLNTGTNYSLDCVSEFPITWKPFAGFTGLYRVEYTERPGSELRYGSTINLINITHYYVGTFVCVVNGTKFTRAGYSIDFLELLAGGNSGYFNGTNGIYISVNDTKNLLVPGGDYRIVKWLGIQCLVIQCKPTSSGGTKLLLLEDGNEMDNRRHLAVEFVGFFVRFSAAAEIYNRTFTCMAHSPNHSRTEQRHFFITYHVPTVRSATGLYGRQSEQLTLTCSIDLLEDEQFTVEWTLPHGNISFTENRVNVSAQTVTDHPTRPDLRMGYSKLIVEDVALGKDEGNYTCEVTDGSMKRMRNQIFIEILPKDDNSIDIYTLSGYYRMEISSDSPVAVWQVKYKGNPKPTLEWYDNKGQIITNSSDKYDVEVTNDLTTLKINDLEFEDSGNYTLKANSLQSTEKRFELRVMVGPSALLKGDVDGILKLGSSAEFICEAFGYPVPKIKWTFTPCDVTPVQTSCPTEGRTTIEEQYFHTTSTFNIYPHQRSVLNINATVAGKVDCIVINAEGQGGMSKSFRVKDMDEPFQIWGVDPHTKIVAGDNVTAICGASNLDFDRVKWFANNEYVESTDGVTVKSADTEYSYRQVITWTNIETTHSGIYECGAATKTSTGTYQSKTLKITVHEPKRPEAESPMETFTALEGEPIRLTCNFSGMPPPSIEWYKNGTLIGGGNGFSFSADRQALDISKLKTRDEGDYKCIGKNREGSAEKLITLNITGVPNTSTAWIVAVTVLFVVLIFWTIYFFASLRRTRRELKSFLNIDGKPGGLNPDLAVHEQADLLSYDKKYEFPKEQLELGEQLGAGAFGVVVQALATRILAHKAKTTVAVKMLKRAADNKSEQVKALTIELKIMVHLGHHPNVLNLLGAVTKNIAKGELMIIVEYCRFGNVQTFLLTHRKSFVNQINPDSDAIDGTVLKNEQRSCLDSSSEVDAPFAETSFITTTSGHDHDYNHLMRIVTTSDLVSWSFQVAKGMEYLASKKVLHGDLAARNILLSDNNMVKICDFGLARSLYECPEYIKDGAAKVPMKWLAIESMCDRVFNTMSDVWSFGVFMWELFSLGETPYPGMQVDQDFCMKLKSGLRMTKPENATQKIYDLMLRCWDADPVSRPSFSVLEEKLQRLLPVAGEYVEMNAPQGQTMRPIEEEVVPVAGSSRALESSSTPSRYLPMEPIKEKATTTSEIPTNDSSNKSLYLECL